MGLRGKFQNKWGGCPDPCNPLRPPSSKPPRQSHFSMNCKHCGIATKGSKKNLGGKAGLYTPNEERMLAMENTTGHSKF